jgi:predicted nucleic acid-binding protein
VIIISDTSPITSLAAIGQLDLLQQLYSTILIPQAVYEELTGAGISVPGSLEVQTLNWLEVHQITNLALVTTLLNKQLDRGECEAITLAIELSADLLLIDERRGRTEANRLGLRITGLLGVLVEAKQKGLILAVKPLIDNLISIAQFRVADELYHKILNMLGEEF